MRCQPPGYWRQHAIRTAQGLTRKHHRYHKAYQCKVCHKWHVTSVGPTDTITLNN